MTTDPVRTALLAVQEHPSTMSPLLLEYFLRGEMLGRMEEKGLTESPLMGALAHEPAEVVAAAVAEALAAGWLVRGGGFYPALKLSTAGEGQLGQAHGGVACHEAAPEVSYRAYHRWRSQINTRISENMHCRYRVELRRKSNGRITIQRPLSGPNFGRINLASKLLLR